MILGQLVRTVWHQGALARAHVLDHCQKLRRRIAFHIQFAALLLTHRLQRLHIPVTGMPLILTRMQRDPMRAQAQATHGECTNIREILPRELRSRAILLMLTDSFVSVKSPARAESLSLDLLNRRPERPSPSAVPAASPDQSELESIRRDLDRSSS